MIVEEEEPSQLYFIQLDVSNVDIGRINKRNVNKSNGFDTRTPTNVCFSMAIFEQQTVKKVTLDDTEPLTCVIENWRNVNGHTEFIIRVHRGPFSDKTWHVYKRYNDFYKLHTLLQTSGIPLLLPPKKLIGNMEPHFISERQQGLQKYLNSVLMNPILVSSLPARSFVDPANYCQPFSELALQHVSLALRGEVGWEVVGPLVEIGWRLRKHYYQVRCKSMPKEDLIGSWTDYGPDKYLDDKNMHLIFKSIAQLKHPYIHSTELCLCTDIGGLTVRSNHKNGSLRDILCGAKSKQSFLKKYGNPKGHKPLELNQVALYGRQILEAIKFLHEKGFPYGHLHSGNVIIENDTIKLLDLENGVLGVPSFYRPYFMQHKKINSLQAIDVYCFGHTLYEMTFGTPLHESTAEHIPDCPAILRSILISILSLEACKSGLPTLESLLSNEFFSSVHLTFQTTDKAIFKIPTAVKNHLKNSISQMEERLKEEQKMVRSQKRLAKVQEMMSSEEEKKKQRHRLRHERNLMKEQQKQKSLNEGKQNNGKINGSSGERSDSVNSSTATSVGTATPPSMTGITTMASPPPPPPPPPPALQDSELNGSESVHGDKNRSALLGAICNFNKSSLRKTNTR